VDQFLGRDRYSSNGTASSGGVYPFVSLFSDGTQWTLAHTASAGLFQTKEWRATLTTDVLDADDWAPHTDPFGGVGIPALEADGDDIIVTGSLSDPRLIGDYHAIGTLTDGQEVWTKDGAPFSDADVAAMVFSAGVDEDDEAFEARKRAQEGLGTASSYNAAEVEEVVFECINCGS
jgi:hypothetical protein